MYQIYYIPNDQTVSFFYNEHKKLMKNNDQ